MGDGEYTIEKSRYKKRIAVSGDSFTSGLGVSKAEVFTEAMKDYHLQDDEIFNFGVKGYGARTDREALFKNRVQLSLQGEWRVR